MGIYITHKNKPELADLPFNDKKGVDDNVCSM